MELGNLRVEHAPTAQTWDAHITRCTNCIRLVTEREKQWRRRSIGRMRRRSRQQFLTRRQGISANIEELREDRMTRLGESLERSTERLRLSYKRVASWESNQHVTALRFYHGSAFTDHMTMAEKFASEWAPN